MRRSLGLLAALALVFNFSIASAQGEAPPDAPEGGAAPAAPAPAPAAAPAPAPEPAAAPAAAPAGAGIITNAGTMTIFGGAFFRVDSVDGTTGMGIYAEPNFGYFLMDNLMLHGGVKLGIQFGDLYEGSAKTFGFNVGAQYFFMEMGAMKMYGGLNIGLDITSPDTGDSIMYLPITVPVGVVYALNQHVGLDLGLRFTFNLGLAPDGVVNTWHLPVGLVGVRGHF